MSPARSSRRPRRALVVALAASFVAFAVLGPAHLYAHAGGGHACATCHVVRHAPATLSAVPTLPLALHAVPLPFTPTPRGAGGIDLPTRSRGPPR